MVVPAHLFLADCCWCYKISIVICNKSVLSQTAEARMAQFSHNNTSTIWQSV